MNTEAKSTVSIKEFMEVSGLSRNAVLKAIEDGRIQSVKKNDSNQWEIELEPAILEYHSNTNPKLSSNIGAGDDEADQSRELTDAEIDKRRSVLKIPYEKWTIHEANQAKTIYEALKSKVSLEAIQGKYYLKEEVDTQVKSLTKLFSDGLKKIPDEFRQRRPEVTKDQLKALEKVTDEIKKVIVAKL